MVDGRTESGWRRNPHEYLIAALTVMLISVSVFDKRDTSGLAVAAALGFSLVGRRLVERHRGAAKRDLQLLMVVFYSLFAALSLGVSVFHEEDRWISALLLSVVNGGFSVLDWRRTTRRHREAAAVG